MNFIQMSDVKEIFDLDENPEKGNKKPYIYQGDCHPLILYCKRPDEEENNHFVHYLFAINDGLCQSVIQEKMQLWMNIRIKYFTLPISTASSLDAPNIWNC